MAMDADIGVHHEQKLCAPGGERMDILIPSVELSPLRKIKDPAVKGGRVRVFARLFSKHFGGDDRSAIGATVSDANDFAGQIALG